MAQQVRDFLLGPSWENAGLSGKISAASAETIQHILRRRVALYLPTLMSMDLFELWRIFCPRRKESNYRELRPAREPSVVSDGKLRLFLGTAPRRIDGARRR